METQSSGIATAKKEIPSVITSYFNLNKRAEAGNKEKQKSKSSKGFKFRDDGGGPNDPNNMSWIQQLIMYLGVVVGVLFSSMVQDYKNGHTISFHFNIPILIISSIIALIIIPLVFQKLNVNPSAPFIVKFGLFVQNGVFWHVLLSSLGNL